MLIRTREGDNMSFPNQNEIKKIREKLKKAEPSRTLSKNSSQSDHIKYKLCEKFVIYLQETQISQVALAKKLKVNPSRVNEIIKYRIDLYTIDKLIELAEVLDLDFEIRVA
jgi:predicted XRE-type DNA-binding protein